MTGKESARTEALADLDADEHRWVRSGHKIAADAGLAPDLDSDVHR